MVLIETYTEISRFGILNNELCTFGLNGKIKNYKFDYGPIFNLGQCIFNSENDQNLTYYESISKSIVFDGFVAGYKSKYGFFVLKRDTKIFYSLVNSVLKEWGEFIPYCKPFMENYFLKTQNDIVTIFSLSSKELWQADISHYGQKRYNHRNEEIDSNTPNTISGEVIGYEDTIVVPLSGKQFVALNINDGSFKWILEYEKRQNSFAYHENKFYIYWRDFIHEIEISTGNVSRKIDVSSIYIEKYNDWPNRSLVSGGKLIIDFLKTDNSLLIIDLIDFTLQTAIIVKSEGFLKANQGDIVWHQEKLYARDSLTNILYVYE